jgi:hypothetical protein
VIVLELRLRPDAFVYLFAMHLNVPWGVDPDSDLPAFHSENGDAYVISDPDAFADAASKY